MTSNHAQIIADAVERTRELIETTALVTAFCDEWFTAPYLQRVYETVWELPRDTMDPGNSHNRLTGMPGLIEPVSDDEMPSRRCCGRALAAHEQRVGDHDHPPRRAPLSSAAIAFSTSLLNAAG